MEQQTIIADIETRARNAGLSIKDVCERAGVHPTTFSRWKESPGNPKPIGASLKSLSAIMAALPSRPERAA